MSETQLQGTNEYTHQLSDPAVEEITALRDTAMLLAGGLRVTWRHPPDGHRQREAIALREAVNLHAFCQRAVHQSRKSNLIDMVAFTEVDTRYEIEAALRTIPEMTPPVVSSEMYGVEQRLPPARSIGLAAWADRLHADFPEITGEWHDWIWKPGAQVRHSERSDEALRDYGKSSVFAIAVGRLSTALTTVLDASVEPAV